MCFTVDVAFGADLNFLTCVVDFSVLTCLAVVSLCFLFVNNLIHFNLCGLFM